MEGIPTGPEQAAEFVAGALADKPDLIVHSGDLPATARALRDLLAQSGRVFERGVPVKLARRAGDGPDEVVVLTPNHVVIEAHRLCRPVKLNKNGELYSVTLPDRVARMYLDMVGEWGLSPLTGITTSALLSSDGMVRTADGYDNETGLWCSSMPGLQLPEHPTSSDAMNALMTLRKAFQTFPFADASRVRDEALGVDVVDLNQPPAQDESAFLAALMTGVCRSSLPLAPGLLVTAAPISGSGTGKGMLVRAICSIAFGIRPRPFTAGSERQELDKRLAAELVEAFPALFLDNVNGATLRSNTLASVLTERPARVRLLGETRMVPLNSTAFIAVTGNGLFISEDLARRFLVCELDAGCEDPEARPFQPGFLDEIDRRRAELLAAALIIWRWGRQNATELKRGRPLGSYEIWSTWVRDPLMVLGCTDPVERVSTLKANDPQRRHTFEVFDLWWYHHGNQPVKAAELAEPVRSAVDPQGRGRQYVSQCLLRLIGTRVGGFVLTRQDPAGKWGASTYALRRVADAPSIGMGHRDHRGHRGDASQAHSPMPPMPPMPDEAELCDLAPGDATVI